MLNGTKSFSTVENSESVGGVGSWEVGYISVGENECKRGKLRFFWIIQKNFVGEPDNCWLCKKLAFPFYIWGINICEITRA